MSCKTCRQSIVKPPNIDCNADPFVPEGWSIEEHIKGGLWLWDSTKVVLHLEPEQTTGYLTGNTLRERLKGKLVLNANVLDYLLAHTELIPEEWKRKYIFFWGTVYRDRGGYLYVRCLCWYCDGWHW